MLRIIGATDKGMRRYVNEDRFAGEVFSPELAYGVVCDGMGGENAGGVASALACEEIRRMLESSCRPGMEPRSVYMILESAVATANAIVYDKAAQDLEALRGMGTTVCLAVVSGGVLYLANVGDSRGYLLREGELRQNIWFFKDGQGNPRWQDTFLYAILQEEWLRQAAGTARKRNIVLIGLSGCGKTTLAPVLSEALGMPAVEMDDEIVKEAGKPISAIFAEDGEKAFRDMETACAKRCAGMDGVIISTGGGVVLREENMAALSQKGLVVFLDRAPMAIAGEDLADRPLLAQNRRNIFSLYEQRIGLYRRYAEVTVENNGPISETTKVLLQKIKEARAWKN